METTDDRPRGLRLRELVFGAVVLVGFSAVVLQLHDVQIVRGAEFRDKSRENFFQEKRIAHDRGEIVDRRGRVLVANRPALNVHVTPAFLPKARRLVDRLGRVVGLDREERQLVATALLKTAEERGPPILLARELAAAEVERLTDELRELEIPVRGVPIVETEAADGEARYAAYLDPEHFPSEPRVYRRLAEALGLSPREAEAFERRTQRATGLERYREILVRSDISAEMGERLFAEIELGELPGVTAEAATARQYRHGRLAAHLLGYVNELTPQELEARRDVGYHLGDVIGRRGVERTFEDDLRGVDGYETVVVDSKGRPQGSRFAESLRGTFGEREPPRAGNRVVLTLDLELQAAAERAFKETAGAIVVMEVHTGRLLVVTSTPSFDPNLVSGYFDPREKARLDAMNDLRPWRFRAIQDQYAPGSTFKPITLLAALRRHEVGPHDHATCVGAFLLGTTRFRCWNDRGHGAVDGPWALAKSCDVYFYQLGNRMGLDPIASEAFDLGFGRKTGIAIDGESDGIMPTEAWYNQKVPEGYTRGAAVNASIGQGAVTSTPLQLAVAYAALANGGTVFEPQVALRVEAFDGKAVREFPPRIVRRVEAAPDDWALVREGLRRVVNDAGGTAYAKRLADLAVSGKTGTAQVARMEKRVKSSELAWAVRDHAWFAAFAPSEAPEIAIVVFVEHGGGGSSVAAPIAMAVADAWNRQRQGRPQLDDPLGAVLALAKSRGGFVPVVAPVDTSSTGGRLD